MYVSKIKRLTEKEVENIEPYKVNSKFIGFDYENVTVIKTFGSKNRWNMVFKCCCGDYFYINNGKLGYALSVGNLTKLNCGCIDKNEEKSKLEEAKSIFYNKQLQSETNRHWCTYCESYRPEVTQKSKNTYNCSNCDFLISKAVTLGESFEEIMARWDPTTHKPCTKKLPYLEGNNKKGYKVRGFTYISSDWYDEASKWLWVKAKDYIKTSFSKENLKRVEKLHLYKPLRDRKHKYMFLHRFILGLGNGVNIVGDHINGFTLDNRNFNLRPANSKQNARNSLKRKNVCLSSFKGVSYVRGRESKKGKINKVWKAVLVVNGVTVLNRTFRSEIEAAQAYDKVLRDQYHSEYNKYNFPREGEISAV